MVRMTGAAGEPMGDQDRGGHRRPQATRGDHGRLGRPGATGPNSGDITV